MSPRLRSTAVTLALLAPVTAVLGCASRSDEAGRTSLAAIATPAAAGPAAPTPSTTAAARCSDAIASLRPPRSLPGAGAMPAGTFMERIQRRGRLVAGVDQNTLLFGYLRPSTGRIEGLEVDFLREIARAILGDPDAIELKALTTAERLPAVQSGAVDIVADAVTITCDRRRQVAFSTVYYDAGQRLLVPKSSHVRALSDLGGRPVCATKGSTTLQRIEADRAKPVPYPVAQRTDCLVALQQGKVAAISSDDAILLGFKAQDPDTEIVGPRLADEPYGMAIARSHPEFVRFVNGVLDRMRQDGRWRAIHHRWIGRLAPTPSPPRPRYRD
jgi:polar amino acid transport system substrate-binding protein